MLNDPVLPRDKAIAGCKNGRQHINATNPSIKAPATGQTGTGFINQQHYIGIVYNNLKSK